MILEIEMRQICEVLSASVIYALFFQIRAGVMTL